jgi:hypothetical protein
MEGPAVTLDEARDHIGHGVVYQPFRGDPEDGVITGVSGTMVFVRYRGDPAGKATHPADLTLLAAPVTVHQRAREDVRQMWQAAFGCDPQ